MTPERLAELRFWASTTTLESLSIPPDELVALVDLVEEYRLAAGSEAAERRRAHEEIAELRKALRLPAKY